MFGRSLPVALVGLLIAGVAAGQDVKVETKKRSVLLATIEGDCPVCAWDVEGREAVTVVLTVDGRYAQHVPVLRTGKSDYRVLLGTVGPGLHSVGIRVDQQHTARELNAKSASIKLVQVDTVAEDDPKYLALSLAPFIYQRPNTVGHFSDIPVFMWYEVEPTERGTRYRYSVIFTNEDGGTPADRLMATWGRTTDIEYVYSVEVDAKGRILAHDYQGPKHEVLPYRGKLEGRHARLWVATDNNMVVDRGTIRTRYAPAPVEFVLTNVSREEVMDANPWLYAIAAKELAREGKIVPNAPPGKGTISDPRHFVYVEGCGELGTLALTFGIRVGNEWYTSDRGIPEYRIVRDGCFRAAIPLPDGYAIKDVRAMRAQAHAREGKSAADAATLTRVNTLFMLDEAYMPGPRTVRWRGSVELRADGVPFEIAIP
jgi:hypothetical protein